MSIESKAGKALFACVLGIALLFGANEAQAHKSPAGCNGSGLNLTLEKYQADCTTPLVGAIPTGTQVCFKVFVSNTGCDVTCATIKFQCPGADGLPGAEVTIASGVDIPSGTSLVQVGGNQLCVIETNAGVLSTQARASVRGIIHDVDVPDCTEGNATCTSTDCDPDIGATSQEVSVVVRHPCVRVTKECDYPAGATSFPQGSPIKIKGTIVNCGDEGLSAITLVDDVFGPVTLSATSLPAPSAGNPTPTITFSFEYPAPEDCGDFTDTVTVTAVGAATAAQVNDDATVECTIDCPPQICIDKQIACLEAFGVGGGPATCGTFGDSATGVKLGDQLPHFCYRVLVWNCGPVAINNVVLNDSTLGVVNMTVGTGTLPANQTKDDAVIVNLTPTGWAVDTRNTATVSGVGADAGATPVEASDIADAFVETIGVTCEKLVSLDDGTPSATIEVPADGIPHKVTYYVRVTNTGTIPVDVSINDAGCALENPIIETIGIDDPETLDVDESVSDLIEVCWRDLTCPIAPEDLTNTVTVSAQANQEGETPICDINNLGDPITATTECSVTITCENVQCVTRTQGYWFNHISKPNDASCVTLEKALTAAGGFDLGFTTVNTVSDALGYFWYKGKSSSQICAARNRLASQLIAAIANVTLLNDAGTCTSGQTLIEAGQAALMTCDIQAINAAHSALDEFNNSGDDLAFPEGLKPCSAGKDQKVFIDAATQPSCPCP